MCSQSVYCKYLIMMNVMMVVEVGVVDVRPVRVLQVEYNNIAKGTIDPSKEPNAHSERPAKPVAVTAGIIFNSKASVTQSSATVWTNLLNII